MRVANLGSNAEETRRSRAASGTGRATADAVSKRGREMDSNQYGWYYGKTNMPIWIFLTPGRWWAELEFHLAGNGRLFLSGRRRRSVVWHLLYSLFFYALVIFGVAFLLSGGLPASSRQAEPAPLSAATVAPVDDRSQEAPRRLEPEVAIADSPSEAEMAPVVEQETYVEDSAADVAPAEKTAPPIVTEKVAQGGAADDLKDLY